MICELCLTIGVAHVFLTKLLATRDAPIELKVWVVSLCAVAWRNQVLGLLDTLVLFQLHQLISILRTTLL